MSLTQETIALSQIEKQRRSYQTLSLTNYDNNLEPQIAAGGRVEDTDTLFYSGSLESITGWAGIGVSTEAYIKIIPQGDGPPETALAEFTDVAPTWSDSKQGFYGTGAAANHRYIGGLYKDASGNYTKKWLYHSFDKSVQIVKIYGDGDVEILNDLEIAGDLTVDVDLNVTGDTVLTGGLTANGNISFGARTSGSQNIANNAYWTIPQGLYILLDSSSWHLQYNFPTWGWQDFAAGVQFVYSDGTNVRVQNTIGFANDYVWVRID